MSKEMKSVLLLLLVALIQSCASDPYTSYRDNCPIYDFEGKLTDALVAMPPEREKELLASIPVTISCPRLCWYQKPSGNILGYSDPAIAPISNTCPGWMGYEFGQKDSKWVFLKQEQYIVLSHSRKR